MERPDRFCCQFRFIGSARRFRRAGSNRSIAEVLIDEQKEHIMSLKIEDFDDRGLILSSVTYDFAAIAVADSRINGADEELTFVFDRKSEFAISNVAVLPQ